MYKLSPIKKEPERQAGQYLREKRDDIINAEVWPPICLALCLICTTLALWLDSRFAVVSFRSVCWTFTIGSAAVSGYAIWKFCTRIRVSRNYSLGERGERVVDDALDDLRFKGYYVFSDLQCAEVGNFDHIAIGRNGVFCLETKAASKRPEPNGNHITFKNGVLYAGGVPLTKPNPLAQVERNARALYKTLFPIFSRKKGFYVKQVIVFPGWFVEDTRVGNAMILTEKMLAIFIPNEATGYSLTDEEMQAVRARMKSMNVG